MSQAPCPLPKTPRPRSPLTSSNGDNYATWNRYMRGVIPDQVDVHVVNARRRQATRTRGAKDDYVKSSNIAFGLMLLHMDATTTMWSTTARKRGLPGRA
ncbi:hypothetical protein Pcac1_g28688 [Phytophthora cactorum]|nr:hypothetical protein Pcac1_g28688 [Phytophthora cactorum]